MMNNLSILQHLFEKICQKIEILCYHPISDNFLKLS